MHIITHFFGFLLIKYMSHVSFRSHRVGALLSFSPSKVFWDFPKYSPQGDRWRLHGARFHPVAGGESHTHFPSTRHIIWSVCYLPLPPCMSVRPSFLNAAAMTKRRWRHSDGSPHPMGGLETPPLAADSLGLEDRRHHEDLVSLRRGRSGRSDGPLGGGSLPWWLPCASGWLGCFWMFLAKSDSAFFFKTSESLDLSLSRFSRTLRRHAR